MEKKLESDSPSNAAACSASSPVPLLPYQWAILNAPKVIRLNGGRVKKYVPRGWEIKEAAADKSIKPEVGEKLEYLWDGYRGEGQWRRCTITKIVEGQSWTRLHERMYYGIDHDDKHSREGILHPRAFRRQNSEI